MRLNFAFVSGFTGDLGHDSYSSFHFYPIDKLLQFDHKSEVFHDTSLSQRKYYYCHLMTPGAKSTILEWQGNK